MPFLKILGVIVAAGVVLVGGSLLVLWLAITNSPLAPVAIVAVGVLAVGGIWLIARDHHRNPFSALPAPDAGASADSRAEAS
jgi:hypothetical protein